MNFSDFKRKFGDLRINFVFCIYYMIVNGHAPNYRRCLHTTRQTIGAHKIMMIHTQKYKHTIYIILASA